MQHDLPDRLSRPRSTRPRLLAVVAGSALGLSLTAGGTAASAVSDAGQLTDTATFINYIEPDPLDGDNGLPTSPAIDPTRYGVVNVPLDVDGNAIQGVVEGNIYYFEGKYYIYSTSHACGSFDMAPGASTTATLPTNPNSYYKYCGLATYESDDLMNWKFVNNTIEQDPNSGRIFGSKKSRVVYSDATGLYTMWFLNGQAGPHWGTYVMQSKSPTGPWSTPRLPDNPLDPTHANLLRDFDLGVGPDGEAWMVKSHGEIVLYQLNETQDGVVAKYTTGADTSILNGGVGIHYENGWWYITGSPGCGNCLGARFSYIMAKDPRGPWTSPDDEPATPALEPTILSEDSGYAQANGSVSVPDASGDLRTFIPFKHYRSSPTGAPGNTLRQPGDANLSLGGQWWYPLTYDDEGRILPMEITPTADFPLAKPVETTIANAYQPDLSVTADRSIVQTWTEAPGSRVRTILPSVFQRTPDTSIAGAMSGNGIPQEPLVNAPLRATLELPDGRSHSWMIDPRTIAWSPQRIPLTLPKTYTGGGQFTLTLSTVASNGGYGVAVGPQRLQEGVYQHVENGTATTFPGASMALTTSDRRDERPRITSRPEDVTVLAGDEIGFAVQAEGVGVGFQWKRNGQIILAPDGFNESTAPTFRRDFVTEADAGHYSVEVFNTIGSVESKSVRLTVLDVATEAALADVGGEQQVTVSATNNEAVPVDVEFATEWGAERFRRIAPGETVTTTFATGRTGIVLGDVLVEVKAKVDHRTVTGIGRAHYGVPLFGGETPG